MHRIFFDTNSGTPDNERYGLWFDLSRQDLAYIPGGPREGLCVVIYMPDELEMEATLVFDSDWDSWTARPVPGTAKYVEK